MACIGTWDTLHIKDIVFCLVKPWPEQTALTPEQKVEYQFNPKHDLGWLFTGQGKEGNFLFSMVGSGPGWTGSFSMANITWMSKC